MIKNKILFVTLAIVVVFANDKKLSYNILQTTDLIDIDGLLDESVWSEGEAITGFIQKDPRPGETATQKTEVRVVLDDEHIYIGAYLFDNSPDSIASQIIRRDGWGYSDWFAVGIDSYLDRRTCFGFWVGPSGSLRDMLHYNDTETDRSWDAVWEAKSVILENGWSAEMKIPLSQLRYNPSEREQIWGVNFYRRTARSGEETFWSPILMDSKGFVSQFGTLTGIQLQKQKKRIEVLPYTAVIDYLEPGEKDNPFWKKNDVFGNLGIDLKLGIGSNFTLTGTINPDFGQVEADPANLNLSAYETFFDERRPFFLEGTDIFQFGKTRGIDDNMGSSQLFYSRRIGRNPRGEIIETGTQYDDYPRNTKIISALKFSGKTSKGLSIGILGALTDREEAFYIDSLDSKKSQIIEPLASSTVVRLKQDMNEGRFIVGGFLTNNIQDLSNNYLNTSFLKGAYVAGFDFEYAMPDPSWVISGVTSMSNIYGDKNVILDIQQSSAHYFQQPGDDNFVDSTKTSFRGTSSEFSIAKISGKNLKGSLTFGQISPGYNVNELGYMRSANSKKLNSNLKYEDYTPGKFWQIFSFSFGSYQDWDYDFKNVSSGIWMESWMRLNNWHSISLDYRNSFGGMNRTFTRGGPLASRPTWNKFGLKFETDRRKKINGFMRIGERRAEDGEYDKSFGTGFNFRPDSRWDLEFDIFIRNEFDTDQYIEQIYDDQASNTYGSRYIFSDISNDSKGMTFEASMIYSPKLSLQFFFSPELGHYQYEGLKEFKSPRKFDFIYYDEDQITKIDDETIEVYPGDADPFILSRDYIRGFNFLSLRSNFIIKWEFKTGSSMFLVWQNERNHFEVTDDNGLKVKEGIDQLLDSEYVTTLMIKIARWFSS